MCRSLASSRYGKHYTGDANIQKVELAELTGQRTSGSNDE
jgi:hypothetical protein